MENKLIISPDEMKDLFSNLKTLFIVFTIAATASVPFTLSSNDADTTADKNNNKSTQTAPPIVTQKYSTKISTKENPAPLLKIGLKI